MQSPVPIGIFRGTDYVLEFANTFYLDILGKTDSIVGKPIFEFYALRFRNGFHYFNFAQIHYDKMQFQLFQDLLYHHFATVTQHVFDV